VEQLVHPGMTVVDIGANIGYYALLLAQSVGPVGHVYAFEPDPPNLQLLRKNVAANGFQNIVTVVPLACGTQSGVTSFSNSSFYGQKNQKVAVIEVKVVSLDDYFSFLGWPQVDLIKMDIEGAEKTALDGMQQLSQRNPQLNIILEFNPFMMKQAGVTRAGFFDALCSLGFSNFWVIKNEFKGEKYLVELEIPRDIDRFTSEFADGTEVNLLCAKEQQSSAVKIKVLLENYLRS
jgi:FkbM family methyltransferase